MTNHEVRQTLKEALVQDLRLEGVSSEDIEDNAPLFGDDSLGLDSLDAVELVVLVEKRFGVVIRDAEEARVVFASVAQLADHIVAARLDRH